MTAKVILKNKKIIEKQCCAIYIVFLNAFQVFEFLIRLHSVEAAQEEEVYPYIRTLLHFDTREFLNVLALVCISQSINQYILLKSSVLY